MQVVEQCLQIRPPYITNITRANTKYFRILIQALINLDQLASISATQDYNNLLHYVSVKIPGFFPDINSPPPVYPPPQYPAAAPSSVGLSTGVSPVVAPTAAVVPPRAAVDQAPARCCSPAAAAASGSTLLGCGCELPGWT
jgi:hypothetical protein